MKQPVFGFFVPRDFRKRAATVKLSPRETEIAEQMIVNEKYEAIAASLGISPHTVDNHRRRIFGKVGVHDRTSLLFFFLNHRQT